MSRVRSLGLVATTVLLVAACAQVPRQTVTLSATVGRDVAEMHRAHRELAALLFARMKGDVNAFVDDVFAPAQIEQTLAKHKGLLVQAIEEGSRPDPTGEAQKTMVAVFQIYLEELRANVEGYRRKLMTPLEEQERDLLASIDEGYGRIHYANSIVTGHLASVVQIQDTQDELLRKANLEGLRTTVSERIAGASEDLAKIVDKARKGEEKLDDAGRKIEEVVGRVKEIAR